MTALGALALLTSGVAWAQAGPAAVPDPMAGWEGRVVKQIEFSGVEAGRLKPLPAQLPLAEGKPLNGDDLRQSLRQLYATGLYETVEARATGEGEGVRLVFDGRPRMFVGMVTVNGAKGLNLDMLLAQASQLTAGTRFTETRLKEAVEHIRTALEQNGFHQTKISYTLKPNLAEQLMDVSFEVAGGPRSRVGKVEVTGEPGLNNEEFQRHAHLRSGAKVDRDTANRALTGVLRHYQKQRRLEAEIKLEKQEYAAGTGRTDYRFSANRGPVVRVRVNGAGLDEEKLRRMIPVFEEGSVDEDLLNEGNRRLRDYYQRQGYFDVKVEHEIQDRDADRVTIVFNATLGPRQRVDRVSVEGSRYFTAKTLEALLTVRSADSMERHGVFSQALMTSDVQALESVYRVNGFSAAKVTSTAETEPVGADGKSSSFHVVYHVEEGLQQRVGLVTLEGNQHAEATRLMALMNTVPGQLFSTQNLAGDRDALMTDYLSRGFDKVEVEVTEQLRQADPQTVDVVFHIAEGQQIFVRKVLVTGLHYTRPDTVDRAITLKPGDPLNEQALLETQRNLYEFALFNQVDTAIVNPTGGEVEKTVLLQTVEARRWVLTWGGGFEAQTGTPQNNCATAKEAGVACSPNGKIGWSPRVLMDLTRNNLFGRDQSASIQGTYGLLEQRVNLLFQNPRFYGNRNFGFTFSGGYANSQDVTTYVASKLEGGVRWTEHFTGSGRGPGRANTLVYLYDFRRVKVSASSLQVYTKEIAELSTAVRVAGPGFTWIRDTRDSPLDAKRGTYTSFQAFLSGRGAGAEAEFSRLDLSNSNFLNFGKGRYVLARNTRYGQERAYGAGSDELIPLPERLYAGGPASLRGFAINAAGPRDLETGYPVGGAGALVNSTELRLPAPKLPGLGQTVSFVLFHDMGNVFVNASDAWASALRVRQPNRETCRVVDKVQLGAVTSTGQQGKCDFNYFTHAPGVGVRYHTPVGPIRLDFSYNLNPPIYPVVNDYSKSNSTPHVGQANHFNFFFSLGQSF